MGSRSRLRRDWKLVSLNSKGHKMHTQTRNPHLSNTFIGFDKFLKAVNDIAATGNANYPPYDIVKIDEANYQISIAAAGFSIDEIEITHEGDKLIIKGEKTPDQDSSEQFLHKGISTRSFTRNFLLTENMKPKEARFKDGLLHIIVEHFIPEEKKPRKISVRPS